MMRIRWSGTRNIAASSTRTEYGFCVEAQTVRPPSSSQVASAQWGSME